MKRPDEPAPVVISSAARAVLQPLPPVAIVGTFWALSDGQTVRIELGGHVEQLQRGGHPRGGAASDPSNSGRPGRYP